MNQNRNEDIEDPKQDSSKRCHNMDPKHQKLLIGLVIFLVGSALIIGIVVGTTGSTSSIGTNGSERIEAEIIPEMVV